MSDDLITKLRHGCIYHQRRWSGDTHADLGWSIQEAETDALMREAADRIEELQAALQQQGEAVEPIGWVFQHDETGRTTLCPNDGVNTAMTFAEINPRYSLVSPAYTHPPKPVVSDELLARALQGWAEHQRRCRITTIEGSLRAALEAALGVKS